MIAKTPAAHRELLQESVNSEMRAQISTFQAQLAGVGYWVDWAVAAILYNFLLRDTPLILEGEPGSGKTEAAYALQRWSAKFGQTQQPTHNLTNGAGSAASVLAGAGPGKGWPLYKLQCFKGIGAEDALYSWNRPLQQLITARMLDHAQQNQGLSDFDQWLNQQRTQLRDMFFHSSCLLPGVMLQALLDPSPWVILVIDEIDKVPPGEGFEALLLEFLGSHQITIQERSKVIKPRFDQHLSIIITSNAVGKLESLREGSRLSVSYPVLRRSSYLHMPLPHRTRLYQILRTRQPAMPLAFVVHLTLAMEAIRANIPMEKTLALSEVELTLDAAYHYGLRELNEGSLGLLAADLGKGVGADEILVGYWPSIQTYIQAHENIFKAELRQADLM